MSLLLDAYGQALGFAFGAGNSANRAGRYDLFRFAHLSAADRERFAR